jgi:predicted acylesterase/phospholipase RssA
MPDVPPARPATRHRYGSPSGQYAEAVCCSCAVHRRFGPFGVKGGYCFQWSADGETWQDAEIHFKVKLRRKR